MSANQPLRKPRHADGRLMSEDEIRGLDGRFLDVTVLTCVILGEPLGLLFATALARNYSSDIAAAFEVNRPGWRWVMDEFSNGGICVMVWDYPEHLPHNSETVQGGEYEVELGHKPTPTDHARARCIAALLLAAKIGE